MSKLNPICSFTTFVFIITDSPISLSAAAPSSDGRQFTLQCISLNLGTKCNCQTVKLHSLTAVWSTDLAHRNFLSLKLLSVCLFPGHRILFFTVEYFIKTGTQLKQKFFLVVEKFLLKVLPNEKLLPEKALYF